MQQLIIREGVLNDDTLYVADSGKVFSGNYVAILEYYTYASEWHNNKLYKRFKSIETMNKYLDKHYSVDELEVLHELAVV